MASFFFTCIKAIVSGSSIVSTRSTPFELAPAVCLFGAAALLTTRFWMPGAAGALPSDEDAKAVAGVLVLGAAPSRGGASASVPMRGAVGEVEWMSKFSVLLGSHMHISDHGG